MTSRRLGLLWLALALAAGRADEPMDIRSIPPDLRVTELSDGPPAAGRRVRETLAGWRGTAVYHVLFLPADWQPGRQFPVLVEYAGNGGYTNQYGDVCLGTPEGSKLGYGIGAGKGYIWLCLPYLNQAGTANVLAWWGDPPRHDPRTTIAYAQAAVRWVCAQYGGDSQRLLLCGFSRGAIACNYLGLHDDEIAGLWRGFVAYSHYDGVLTHWPYPGADRASAMERLRRLKSRPQFICGEGRNAEQTRRYLSATGVPGDFTFASTGFRNHNDEWILRPSSARDQLRNWVREVMDRPPPKSAR